MKRLAVLFVMISIFFVGCGSTSSFEGTLDEIKENSIVVNCSNEMNKGKKGAIDDVGYLCLVQITDNTIFSDSSGDVLSIQDFQQDSAVRIILTNAVNIKKDRSRNLVAKEIILLPYGDEYIGNKNYWQSSLLYLIGIPVVVVTLYLILLLEKRIKRK